MTEHFKEKNVDHVKFLLLKGKGKFLADLVETMSPEERKEAINKAATNDNYKMCLKLLTKLNLPIEDYPAVIERAKKAAMRYHLTTHLMPDKKTKERKSIP